MPGVVVVLVARGDEAGHLLRHAVVRVPLQRVGDVVRARRRRPAALLPRLLLVVRDPHRAERGDLDLVGVAARLLGAGAHVVDRPAHGRGMHADVDHRDVRERAGQAQVLRPGRADHDRHPLVRPADAACRRLSSPAISARSVRHRLGQLGRRHRLQPERPHRVVAAADPEHDAAGVQVGERRMRARRHRRVARERVRDRHCRRRSAPSPRARASCRRRGPARASGRRRARRARSRPRSAARTDSRKTGKSSGQEVRAELHRAAAPGRRASPSSDRTSPQPTRIISSAGSCRCGSVVPVHSSTTIGLKSRNIASFDVAATHWFVSTPRDQHRLRIEGRAGRPRGSC